MVMFGGCPHPGFQADGQSEVFAGLGEPVHETLEFLLSV